MDGARDSGINANHVSSSGGEREKGRARGTIDFSPNYNLQLLDKLYWEFEISRNKL